MYKITLVVSALILISAFELPAVAQQMLTNSNILRSAIVEIQPDTDGLGYPGSSEFARSVTLDSNPLVELVKGQRGRKELEVVDYQVDEISNLRNKAIKRLKELNQMNPSTEVRDAAERTIHEYHKSALGVLLPHQKERLANYQLLLSMKQSGLVDLLINGPLGNRLELDNDDRSRLVENNAKMREYLNKQEDLIRKKAVEILIADLPAEKKKSVVKFVDLWKNERFADWKLLTGSGSASNCVGCEKAHSVNKKR